ncbi:MAG: AraC family transcriptional regulator [Ruminococcus sp.]
MGYDNALYFSRLFRKHIGMSPREYRRAHVTPDEKHPC